MSLERTWIWLESTAMASAVREGVWLYPAIETLHILGLATLVGSIVLLDLRLLGASRWISIDALARHALPVAYGAFAVQLVTGFVLFASDASTLAVNVAFRVKIVLIGVAVLNALAFNLGPFRRVRAAPAGQGPSTAVRAFAAVSILLWVGVVVCGRLIAYV